MFIELNTLPDTLQKQILAFQQGESVQFTHNGIVFGVLHPAKSNAERLGMLPEHHAQIDTDFEFERANITERELVLFEIETGILRKQHKDPIQGQHLRQWFEQQIKLEFAQRIIPISSQIALRTAKLHVPNPMALMDSFIAATAIEHNLILVTRNVKDFANCDVEMINPFE